ncbi:hypothetical protein PsorP6_015305 [Peronosclerospora sorghi]|uniref:Uncharacterized protein n=1 Tax=Peronosclerospora sorghi TaxID=230839 RepID=A0ACC0VUE4_9STRA|nr:hypothetical protein PsorP6_015305 [Peronosclerospora sorghi]
MSLLDETVASLQEANKLLALNMKVRLWRVKVCLAVRNLLSLGRTYDLLLEPVENLQLATNCGIYVKATMNSHVFQVEKTKPPQYPIDFLDQEARRFFLANIPISTALADDYLVGIGSDDLPLCAQKLKQLHKDVAEYGSKVIIKQEHQKLSRRMLGSVTVDLRQAKTSGRILRVLDEMAVHHLNLAKRYDKINQAGSSSIVTTTLGRETADVREMMTGDARNTLMQNRRFQFMDKFRRWCPTITDTKDHAIYKDADMTKDMEQPIGNLEVELSAEQPKTILTMTSRLLGQFIVKKSHEKLTKNTRCYRKNRFQVASGILNTLVPEKKNDSGQHVERVKHVPALNLESILSKASTTSSIRTYGVEEGRSYLLALICPNVDLVSSLQELAKTIKTLPVLNKEFKLAPGLKLRCEVQVNGPSQCSARVRLIVSLTRHNCTKLLEWPRKDFSNITYDVLALVQKLPVVCSCGALLPSKKGEVGDALMEFLIELVDEYEESLKKEQYEAS